MSRQKKGQLTPGLLMTLGLLLYGWIGTAGAAPADPNSWVLGNRLMIGALILIVIGFFTGIYALLFTSIGPAIRRVLLYPLFKTMGEDGDRKPLITKK